jgi:hypothetical protein
MSTIAEQLQELAQIKEEIRQAIIAKGVTVSSDAAFSTYATAIRQISGGGGGEELAALIDRSITSITIPSGVTKIGHSAFRQCQSITSITLPNGVTQIDASAFERCQNLLSINIPSGVTSIGSDAFHNCSKLASLIIPNTVTSIGNYCFSDMSVVTSITLSENITSMGIQVFPNCAYLESIDIPEGVSTMNTNFFSGCHRLSEIICRRTTPPTVNSTSFGSGSNNYTGRLVASGKVLYVPYGCSSAYTSANNEWKTVLLEPTKCNFTIAELNADGTKPNS